MKKTILTLFSVVIINLSGNEQLPDILQKDFKVTLEWLDLKPQSYAKDFFIIQYLKQDNISIEDAKKAYEMAQSKNSLVKKEYNKLFKSIPSDDLKCYNYSINELLKLKDIRCVALGLSLSEAIHLSSETLDKFISKLDKYPTLKKDLEIIKNNNISDENLYYGFDEFFKFFFKLGYTYRIKNFDKDFSKEFINKLAEKKQFEMLVRYTIYDKSKLQNLQKALLNVEDNKDLTTNTLFLLGINAINHNDEEKAFYFFLNSYKKAYLKQDQDKNLFWIYLITQNEIFLHELSKSWSINLYSTFAKELLDYPIDNVFYELSLINTKSDFNIYDQFLWMEVLEDTKKDFDEEKFIKYQNIFTDELTLPQMTFIQKRYEKYKNEYFITPYKEFLKDYTPYKKSLIYALGKQESNFIPSSISVSTAQGVMQIMPFLSEDIAKELKEEYNIYNQFNPETNLRYANFHLEKLMKMFNNNPLFIAYAYNGGAGYIKSQFKKGLFERIDKKYEPFLSMEMVSYPETKEYGKKVLTNYYFYNNYLNPENKIKLSTIFQTLIVPN